MPIICPIDIIKGYPFALIMACNPTAKKGLTIPCKYWQYRGGL